MVHIHCMLVEDYFKMYSLMATNYITSPPSLPPSPSLTLPPSPSSSPHTPTSPPGPWQGSDQEWHWS